MKRFFYASAAVLMLAIAYHFGAGSAKAQVGGSITGLTFSSVNRIGLYVATPSGDIFFRALDNTGVGFLEPAVLVGNFWSGAPTPAQQQSWGQLKTRYR